MKITEEEQKRRKNRIIETAFQLFCEKGIESVSLADIAQQSKVGNTTIYRYFGNKPQLVLETMSVLWAAIGGKIEEKVRRTEGYQEMSGLEQLVVQLESCRQLYLDSSDYVLFSYESKLYLLRNNLHLTIEEYDLLMREVKYPCVLAIEKGKKDGSIPTDENSEDIFYALWGAIRGYIVKIVIYNSLCSDESPWESRYHVIESGILSALSNGWKQREQ